MTLKMASQHRSLFDTFPDELIALIVDYTDSEDLPALTRVNRSCYRVVIPRLYACINYSGDDHPHISEYLGNDMIAREKLAVAGHVTKILNLEKLQRTLNECPKLKSLIVVAAIFLKDSCTFPVCNVLQSLPTKLNRLHMAIADPLSASSCVFDQITSLSLNREGWWPFGYPDDSGELQYFSQIFKLPRLKELQIMGICCAFPAQLGRSTLPQETSEVTSMSLSIMCEDADILIYLVYWPRVLRCLYLKLACPPYMMFDIFDLLSFQGRFLEKLVITEELTLVPRLQGWTAFAGLASLKTLAFPVSFLFQMNRLLRRAMGDFSNNLHLNLPTNLEHLLINTGSFGAYTSINMLPPESRSNTHRNFGIESTAEGLSIHKFLSNLSIQKLLRYPRLRRITLWHKAVSHTFGFSPTNEALKVEISKFVVSMKDLGVELELFTHSAAELSSILKIW
jgi:hypothetical protein